MDIYKKKGFSTEDANMIINLMTKQRDFFVDHMMVQVRPYACFMTTSTSFVFSKNVANLES